MSCLLYSKVFQTPICRSCCSRRSSATVIGVLRLSPRPIFSWIIMMALRRLSGRGGQPATYTSTGTNWSMPWTTEYVRVHSAGGGAHSHRDDPFWVGHLIVNLPDHLCHFVRRRSCDDQQVALPRRKTHDFGPESRRIEPRVDQRHHFDSTARYSKRHWPHGIFSAPVDRCIDLCRNKAVAQGMF